MVGRTYYIRHFLSEFLCKLQSYSEVKVVISIVKPSFMPFVKDAIFYTL